MKAAVAKYPPSSLYIRKKMCRNSQSLLQRPSMLNKPPLSFMLFMLLRLNVYKFCAFYEFGFFSSFGDSAEWLC